MKALILNSGMGTRMGVHTSEHPKCMTELLNRETILSRQLTMLLDCGVTDVVILDEKATATVFCIEDDAVFLSQIGVLPGLRGGGWGRKLLTAAMQSYVGKTCYVFSKNENADRFYHALGFVPVGSWQDYFRKDQENDS